MTTAYEEKDSKEFVQDLRALDISDQPYSLPLVAEALVRIIEKLVYIEITWHVAPPFTEDPDNAA